MKAGGSLSSSSHTAPNPGLCLDHVVSAAVSTPHLNQGSSDGTTLSRAIRLRRTNPRSSLTTEAVRASCVAHLTAGSIRSIGAKGICGSPPGSPTSWAGVLPMSTVHPPTRSLNSREGDDTSSVDSLVRRFKARRPLYEDFTAALSQFFEERLKIEGISNAIIQSRTKSIRSFGEKISRPGKHYREPFSQITDLSGVRIIVCYKSDLPRIESILERELAVDEIVNKSDSLEPDTFGYLAVHYIVTLDGWKLKARGWKRFGGLKAEIQLKTQLQHSWAVVSHALYYKRESDVPKQLKRRLFRLAGLFELADEEFLSLKIAHDELQTKVSEEFETHHRQLPVDIFSIVHFVRSSPVAQEIVEFARGLDGLSFYDDRALQAGRDDYSLLNQECKRLEINTIGDLEDILSANTSPTRSFLRSIAAAEEWNVTAPFLLFLSLIPPYARAFSANYLIRNRGWATQVAERVHRVARSAASPNNS